MDTRANPSLTATNISLTRGTRQLLDGVGLQLKPGELHAVLGANGAGKSSLLRVLAGEIQATRGSITLNARALYEWSARERACLRAVLPQFDHLQTDFMVEQVVSLGRTPCWEQSATEERRLVLDAMQRAECETLAARHYLELSGGERARVQLARVLAQVSGPLPPALANLPRYLLLDEPTASLDMPHRHACLRLAKALAKEGLGVLAILHDPDLALRYADQVTVMKAGQVIAQGAIEATLSSTVLEEAYGVQIERIRLPGRERPILLI